MDIAASKYDPRIRNLSYSSLLTLHSCPRKYQLYKLQAERSSESFAETLTFAFGHMVGNGIQDILQGDTYEQAAFKAFINWPIDIFEENPKQYKSFWQGLKAFQAFTTIREFGHLKDYELVYYEGKPAVELSFAIHFPDGFVYRGFVDAVLKHKYTGEVLVLENKTTGAKSVNPAQYKNSAQAIGYSIILDAIFSELSSYKVLYLIYQTWSVEFLQMPFVKTYAQRALWLQELLLDIETIKMYEEVEIFPSRGESCFSYMRECEYFGMCHMSNTSLTSPLPSDWNEKNATELLEKYQIHVTFEDLIKSQQSKAGTEIPAEADPRTNVEKLLDDEGFL